MSDLRQRYDIEQHGEQGRMRHGSPHFYELLQEMAETHDRKSHDYASDENPFGNYHFAGKFALLFGYSEEDAGFAGRVGEKLYRLANLEGREKLPKNESIEDTERDICVITCLWMTDRKIRRDRENYRDRIPSPNAVADILSLVRKLDLPTVQELEGYISSLRVQLMQMGKEAPLGHIAGQSLPRKSE